MYSLTERLQRYLALNQNACFDLGVHDCATFACKWLDSELGTNYLHELQLLAKKVGMARLRNQIVSMGGYTAIAQRLSGQLGEVGPGKLGDVVVLVPPGGTETLGIQSQRLIHVPGEYGTVMFDVNTAQRHWSLECLKPQHT